MSGETGTRDRVEHPLGRRFELYAQMRLAAWASGRTVPAVTREALQAKLQAMRRPHQAWLNRFADGGEVCLGFLRDRLGPPRRAWALAGLVGVAAVTVLWWRSEATGHPLTARASTPPAAAVPSSRIRFSAASAAGIPRFPTPTTMASRPLPEVDAPRAAGAGQPQGSRPESAPEAKPLVVSGPEPVPSRPVVPAPSPEVAVVASLPPTPPAALPSAALSSPPPAGRTSAHEWRFARLNSGGGSRRNLNSPALPDVLREFAVVQTDDAIVLVDADGSVYPLSFELGTRWARDGSAAGNPPEGRAVEEEGLGFQAVGVHRTTGESVVLRGRLVPRHPEGLPVRAVGGAPALPRLAKLAKGDFIIRGEIQYGERTRFHVEAAPLDGAI